jgi:hypothetical protein
MWALLLAAALDPRTVFLEARKICEADHARLWGRSLCGPMLLADPGARRLIANQPDSEKQLKKVDGLWTAPLPRDLSPANTAQQWAGIEWTMLVWPLPEDPVVRRRLLAHEMWHRIQSDLMIPMMNGDNPHLDTEQGRVTLRLEFRALAVALQSPPQARRPAIRDALAFRAERRRLFPDALNQETALENNEGLAEWTGITLDGTSREQKIRTVLDQLRTARPSYVRSFAYVTGPAWGLLLDDAAPGWHRRLGARVDMSSLLAEALKINPDPLLSAERSLSYDGAALRKEESDRARDLADRQARYRALFVDGPTLTLLLTPKMQFAFNPNKVVSLPGYGTVYPALRVTDVWGVLEVTGGALMARDWGSVTVALPLEGKGWTLQLKPGHKRKRWHRPGDQILDPTP